MNKIENNKSLIIKKQSFKGELPLKGIAKAADIFIKSQENLSSTRFIQDTATNWVPKAIFSRSKEDFAEMSFLEFIESGIFYFASPILGEKLFRNKIFKNFQPKSIKEKINEQIPKKIDEIIENKALSDNIKRRAISTKAGIVLACTIVPVAEYTLSFAKNLFTLKLFNKSNFNNIANLNKNSEEKEDNIQQKRVESNSKKQIKKAILISLVGILAGSYITINGHKTEKLQTLSKTILEPGKAIANKLQKSGIQSKKVLQIFSKFSLDFDNNNGKLALSKGQLALTAILGLFGYSKAAKDRGKLDVAEVWTRVPLVVFYTIFGSELVEKGFIKIIEKKKLFPDILNKAGDGKYITAKRRELVQIAQNLAETKNSDYSKELSRLIKEKAIITGIPYAFSLLAMGFTLSAITRLFTQYRYNKQIKNEINKNCTNIFEERPSIFKDISI